MRIPILNVPIQSRRLAAQHLASIIGTDVVAGVQAAFLQDYAVPVYRPDIDGVAYYEFSIARSKGRGRVLVSKGYSVGKCAQESSLVKLGTEADAAETPIGFVIVANGRHDFPISHWSLNRLPPSQQIATDPRRGCDQPQPGAAKAAKLYRLDVLAYAAENDAGELVGQTGPLPGAISGLPHSLEKLAGRIESSIAPMERTPATDEGAQDARQRLERSMKSQPQLSRDDEGGWKGLKERYADVFGPMLDHLRRRAAKTWELNDLIEKFGEGIEAGATHPIALLDHAAIEFSGDGSRYVDTELQEGGDGPPTLVLRAKRESLSTEQDLDLHIRYRNGEQETLKFFIYSRAVPSNEKARQSAERNPDCEE
jgi:hypothetical protein